MAVKVLQGFGNTEAYFAGAKDIWIVVNAMLGWRSTPVTLSERIEGPVVLSSSILVGGKKTLTASFPGLQAVLCSATTCGTPKIQLLDAKRQLFSDLGPGVTASGQGGSILAVLAFRFCPNLPWPLEAPRRPALPSFGVPRATRRYA